MTPALRLGRLRCQSVAQLIKSRQHAQQVTARVPEAPGPNHCPGPAAAGVGREGGPRPSRAATVGRGRAGGQAPPGLDQAAGGHAPARRRAPTRILAARSGTVSFYDFNESESGAAAITVTVGDS